MLFWRTGEWQPVFLYTVYNAKTTRAMSTSISLGRRSAAPAIRISGSSLAKATAAIGTVLTVIGVGIGSDPLALFAATASLAAFFSLDKKKGAPA